AEAPRSGEEGPAYTLDLIDAGTHKHAKPWRQQLIDTDTSPIHLPLAIGGRLRSHAHPQAIVPLDMEGRVIVNLANHERLAPEIFIQNVGCLRPKAKPEIAAGVPPQRHTDTIHGLLEHGIVHQCLVQELGRFVIGKDIAIKIVGEIKLPTKEVEAIVDKLQPQPGFANGQLFVRPPYSPYRIQRLGIRVHTRQPSELLICPAAAD